MKKSLSTTNKYIKKTILLFAIWIFISTMKTGASCELKTSSTYVEEDISTYVAEDINGYTVFQVDEWQGLKSPDGVILIEPNRWLNIELHPGNQETCSYTDYGFCLLIDESYYAVFDLHDKKVIMENQYQGIKVETHGGEAFILAYEYEKLPINGWIDSANDMPSISIFRWNDRSLIISTKAMFVQLDENSNAILFRIWLDDNSYSLYTSLYKIYSYDGKELLSIIAERTTGYHEGLIEFELKDGSWISYDDTGRRCKN